MDSKMGLSSAWARDNASGPHGYHSTGLSACCLRYGLDSVIRRLGTRSVDERSTDHPSVRLVIVHCDRQPCNESHSPCYSAQPDDMKRCLTTCFACGCFTFLASPLFAGSSLESTLSSAGALS